MEKKKTFLLFFLQKPSRTQLLQKQIEKKGNLIYIHTNRYPHRKTYKAR